MNAVKILYYITFLFALGAFIMLSMSLPTEYMVTATIVNSGGQTTGSINFGIFRGSKLLTTDDAGASEVKEFLVFDEYNDSLHPLIVYIAILTTCFAVVSALIATILSFINIFKNEKFSSAVGPMALGFYNMLGAILSSVTLILLTSVLFGTFDGEVTSTAEQNLGYSSTGVALGYSFWLQMASIALLSLNCGTIILAQSYKNLGSDKSAAAIPRLTRSTKTRDVL
ncbi:clarin-3-like [Apostichopus japonicus]|uniref:clarin-3-like n=1 Tax=Stichopus japonicus TaxID=307972 RepID=UPI003AB65BA4